MTKAVEILTALVSEGLMTMNDGGLSGVPDGSRDAVVEKSILLESNFDELNGIDWKGLFYGPRADRANQIPGTDQKTFSASTIEGEPPEPGADILFDGKNAGEMRPLVASWYRTFTAGVFEAYFGGRGYFVGRGRIIVPRNRFGRILTCGCIS